MGAIPLLAIPLILLNLIVFFIDGGLVANLLSFKLPSGEVVALSRGDGVIALGLILLYFEIFKSTRTGTSSIVDHMLSLALLLVALIEFLLVKGAGNSAFLFFTIMALLDVIAGFTVSISVARRDIDLVRGGS